MGICFPILNISCWTAFIVLSYFFLLSSYYPMKQKPREKFEDGGMGEDRIKELKIISKFEAEQAQS